MHRCLDNLANLSIKYNSRKKLRAAACNQLSCVRISSHPIFKEAYACIFMDMQLERTIVK